MMLLVILPGTTRSQVENDGTGKWALAGPMVLPRIFSAKTSVVLPSGDVIAAGGALREGVGIAQRYSPALWRWSRVANMLRFRMEHSMTVLHDGSVLVVGGFDDYTPGRQFSGPEEARGAERYFPDRDEWLPAGEGITYPERARHIAAILQDGRVLVAGGCYGLTCEDVPPLTHSEIYDPTTNKWQELTPMGTPRSYASAVSLQEGRVLVVGGSSDKGTIVPDMSGLQTAEIYDPVSGRWTPTGGMARPRWLGTATLMLDGRVLAAGHTSPMSSNPWLVEQKREATSEIFDPTTGTWGHLVEMNGPSDMWPGAVRLQDGRVFVAGGARMSDNIGGKFPPQIYDHHNHHWLKAAQSPSHTSHSPTEDALLLLRDGSVLRLGSQSPDRFFETPPTPSATPTETATPSDTPTATATETATATPTDTPTSTVTSSPTPSITPTRTASPTPTASRTPTITPTPTSTRQRVGVWQRVASPSTKRYAGSAVLMTDGKVLVVGGTDGVNKCCIQTEIYSPFADTWTQLPAIDQATNVAFPQLLQEGPVTWLTVGGTQMGAWLTDLFDNVPLGLYARGWYVVGRLDTRNRTSERVASISGDPLGVIDPKGPWAIGEVDDQRLLMANFQDRATGGPSDRTIIYDRKTWVPASGPHLEQVGRQRLMVSLADGRLLVLGGRNWVSFWDGGPRAFVEGSVKLILDSSALGPDDDRFKQLGPTRTHFRQPYSQLLALPSGGAVAIAGRGNGEGVFNGGYEFVESFDPRTNTWTLRGKMTAARPLAAAQVLHDDLVLIAGGGWETSNPTQSADILDLSTGRWYDAGPMSVPRVGAASVRLADGRLLVIGGDEAGTAEVFSLGPNALPSTLYIPWAQSSPPRR